MRGNLYEITKETDGTAALALSFVLLINNYGL